MNSLRAIVAALHLLALGIGLWAVLTRSSALRDPVSAASLKRVFRADSMWGVAALLWLATGLWRLFGGLEKGTEYYFANYLFHAKMTLFVLVVLLEAWPAYTLTRWRFASRSGKAPESLVHAQTASRIAIIGHVEALLVVLIVFAATALARGIGIN